MRLATSTVEVGRTGVLQENAFSIKATGKAMRALSSGLYSRKVEAIVREISCNAYDAHLAVGKADLPFHVHLPNALEPFFRVRDFGTGLSHENMLHLYTTYFDTTKFGDEIGGFGLGTKSPFCLAPDIDSFSVVSYFNGEKRSYTAFIGEDDIFSIAMMGNPEETTECNGLEVTVPVKNTYIYRFAEDAKKIYQRFPTHPIVTGNPYFVIPTMTKTVVGSCWALIDDSNDHRANAIQGFVAYPIDSNFADDLTADERAILLSPIDIDFTINDLQPAISREALEYDKKTIANIKTKLATVVRELPKQFQHHFDKCQSLWEAKLLYYTMFAPSSQLGKALNQFLSNGDGIKVIYKGEPIKDATIKVVLSYGISIYEFEERSRKNRFSLHTEDLSIVVRSDTTIFIDDLPRGGIARVKQYRRDYGSGTAYVIHINDHLDPIANAATCLSLTALKNSLDGASFVLTSSLPKRVYSRTYSKRTQRARISVLSDSTCRNPAQFSQRSSWQATEIDMADGGIYIVMRYSTIMDGVIERDNFREILTNAQAAGLIDLKSTPVYGISTTIAKQFRKHTEWTDFFTLVRAELTTKIDHTLSEQLAYSRMLNEFSCDDYDHLETIGAKVDASSGFCAFMATWNHAIEFTKPNVALQKIAANFMVAIPELTLKYSLTTLWDAVCARYPLLPLILRGVHHSTLDDTTATDIANYINGIDNLLANPRK